MATRPSPETNVLTLVKTHTSNYDAPYTTNLGNVTSYQRSYLGTKTPGWSSLTPRQREKLPVNDYWVSYLKRSSTAYVESTVTKYGGVTYTAVDTWSNMLFQLGSPSVVHLDEAYTKARAECASKMNSMGVNLGQVMGEMKQTANLICDSAVRIASLAVAIKKADLTYLRRHYSRVTRKFAPEIVKMPESKRLSKYWLEYQYGWKPLMQDIHGAGELLARHIANDRWHGSVEGRGTHSRRINATDTYTTSAWLYKTNVRIGLRYNISDADRAVLATTGIDNPALLAWELLPYSFVVDWFVPVGNYLEALNAFSGFNFLDGFVSKSSKLLYTEDRTRKIKTAYGYKSITGLGVHRNEIYERKKLASFPAIGNLNVKNPIGGEPIARLATATALLAVLFK